MNFWERQGGNNGYNSSYNTHNGNGQGGENTYEQGEKNAYGQDGENAYGQGVHNGAKRQNDTMRSGNLHGNGAPLEEQLKKYSGMDQNQLMSELMRTAGAMKNDGKLNGAELEAFYSQASAFMTAEQLKRLRELINMLK